MTDQTDASGTDITGLTCDSRQVEPGFLFAALPGSRADGRAFIADALDRGAVAVLAPDGAVVDLPRPVAMLTAANPRRQYALIAANFFETQPDVIAAVTGTNGKTSVVTFLRQIWSGLGRKAASAGTLGIVAEGFENRVSLTTPDPADLHRNLRDLTRFGVERLALEASSHGLVQHRLDGVRVKLAAFTNLTRDHLDYHRDMADYLAAKLRLFTDVLAADGVAVVNADSTHAEAVTAACRKRGIRVMSYGAAGDAVRLVEREPLPDGQRLVVVAAAGRKASVTLPLLGAFQASNALCALALAVASGEDAAAALGLLQNLKGAPGRMQFVGRHPNGAGVFVDYAHSPDALANVLNALRPHAAGRLHVVFGCGGDRDPGKRPEMGAIAADLADAVVVTDDNPRGEDAAAIRRQVLAACPGATDIGDRALAIREAVRGLAAGDLLVVAGKGHERGQIVGAETRPFDDTQAVRDALREIDR